MATESKHVFAALCETHLGRRRLTGNEARPKQRICAAVSNDVLGMGRPLRPERQGCQRQGTGASCNWHESGRFRFPRWQTMCARGLNETNMERKRRGFHVRLNGLLGSSASAYAKAHRPASSNSAPRLALVTSHRPAAIDARIEHRRAPASRISVLGSGACRAQ